MRRSRRPLLSNTTTCWQRCADSRRRSEVSSAASSVLSLLRRRVADDCGHLGVRSALECVAVGFSVDRAWRRRNLTGSGGDPVNRVRRITVDLKGSWLRCAVSVAASAWHGVMDDRLPESWCAA